jgi:hypothetical protein
MLKYILWRSLYTILIVDGQVVVLPVYYSNGQRSERQPMSQNIHS